MDTTDVFAIVDGKEKVVVEKVYLRLLSWSSLFLTFQSIGYSLAFHNSSSIY